MKQVFKTNNDWAGFFMRITAGFILLAHGSQKALGLFGGQGMTATIHGFTQNMGMPAIIAVMVIAIEFIGSICMILGFASRFWAMCMIGLMIGIIATVHYKFGFFMNWHGDKKGEGFEYHLLFIGLCIGILLNGSGRMSIDTLIYRAYLYYL